MVEIILGYNKPFVFCTYCDGLLYKNGKS